jgi:hypothetical protein
VEGRE